MKYIVVHRASLPTGQTVEKWFPSVDYEQMADHLLESIASKPKSLDWLAVPFILTLAASLEANLNDWLLLDTLHKHGMEHYRPIVEGYLRCSFSKKLRLTVAVVTDNHFHLAEDSKVTITLDELISVRNRLTHPNADFVLVDPDPTHGAHKKFRDHPVHSLKLRDCRRYQSAVSAFDRKFFRQYDRGVIEENDLVKAGALAMRELDRRVAARRQKPPNKALQPTSRAPQKTKTKSPPGAARS